ncbi:hypothetical protein U713_14065 [Rhodobacter capsulatus YW2]|nr:hypothetical protein U713_14065 [Rhodobacter capsulatus YW2]
MWGQDELQSLRYAIMLNCSTGDDGGQAGVKRVTVAEIETGRKQGSVATLRALADALGVSLDDLTE